MIMKVIIINGPNLNLLKDRNTDVYGDMSFEDYYATLKEYFFSIDLDYYQSNIEGEMINKMQEVVDLYDYIILSNYITNHFSNN